MMKQNLDKDKLRILLWSACPWANVGYGTQAKGICEAMLDLGHEVAFQSLYGLLGASINWKGVPIYPARNHPLGWDVVENSARHFGADLIVSLYDIWALPLNVGEIVKTPWAALTPIDGAPMPQHTLSRLRQVEYPVALAWRKSWQVCCLIMILGSHSFHMNYYLMGALLLVWYHGCLIQVQVGSPSCVVFV